MADSLPRHDPPTESHRDAGQPTGTSTEIAAHTEELAHKTAELSRKTTEFEILQRVSSAITSTLDLEEIYDVALRTMDELFEFHHANILLVEPGGEMLAVVASHGYENQAMGGRVRIGAGVIGIVAQRRKILHVSNLGQKRAYAAAQRQQMMKSGRGAELGDAVPVPGLASAESQIAIPLLIRGELIGVFSIESPVRRTFSEHDRGLVSIVANQIASAIKNAKLYEERSRAAVALQEVNASLEARVTERTAALQRELSVAQELLKDARSRVEGPLLGESPAVRALREAIAHAAAIEGPLLLVGPPGAGKEAVARAVHDASRRRGAFIFVSCPDLNNQLRHGSTDASPANRPERAFLAAKLELAAGGTVFLDAVERLPLAFRCALQELLEDSETHSSGSPSLPTARVIASTTQDLSRAVGGGRLDPLHRLLSTRQIDVPALVDRRQDITVLVDHFVRRQARHLGKTIDGVSTESMRRLEAYVWPGNIRELRTVIERAILVARGTVLEIDKELLDEGLAVGSYHLVSHLGTGGMGEVWLAKHRLLARPAAVKLIRHDVVYGPAHEDLVRRFQREARVTSALRSPHTVQLYDFGVNDTGTFYYVMELLEGFDLQHIVARFGPQPWQRVVVFLRQACRSLAEAHAHGLVHRDIKPANLFVTIMGSEYDYLKVLDFGIVKDKPGHEATALSARDVLQGTPAFMAPERMLEEGVVDGRSDLYSLACTAYWALTGQPVFQASSPAQMLLHHVQSPPAPPSTISELPIPRGLESILMRCLEKDPATRFPSALDLDRELENVPCEKPWTQQKAQAWWEAHAPDVAVRSDR
jgi:DNA-binding NtrC family response regulator